MHRPIRHNLCFFLLAVGLTLAGCAPAEVEWLPVAEVASAEVRLSFRATRAVDFPELALGVLSDMDDWAPGADRSDQALCTVIFAPTNFSYADVAWVGPDWIGTSYQERSWYRELSPSEADLLREALGLAQGQCEIPPPSADPSVREKPGVSSPGADSGGVGLPEDPASE